MIIMITTMITRMMIIFLKENDNNDKDKNDSKEDNDDPYENDNKPINT